MNPEYINNVMSFPYKLDGFQIDAIDAILKGHNVLTLSHTGSGKSTIGEFAIANAIKNGKRAIYTTPIKALSNQKYGDFQKKFSGSCVGILTGDIKVNPDAQILVATQEIICNLLYTNIEYFEDVGTLIIDETHYLRDADRGTIYEQTIAMIPKNIVLVMLSATLPGAQNLAKWVEDIKKKPCVMTSTNVRPVPLVHQVYWNGEYKQVLEGDHNLDEQAYKSMFNVWKESKNVRLKDKPSDSTTLIKFLDNLSERELFPALFFQFSRKGCERLAKMIQRSWLDGKEQTQCINLFDFYVRKYLGEQGMQLSQVWMIRAMLSKGVAVHHSGLIPVLKEIIESIFDKGWIRVMFVTETFSVGINMPTKCVVFSELQKFDGKEQRCLLPPEYIQMAGRAGRRGKDTLGTVIYFPFPPKNMVTLSDFANIIKGKHSTISSKFIMDPVLLLKCIETNRPPSEVFDSTLMSKEIENSIKGIDYEIAEVTKQFDSIPLTKEQEEKYNEIKAKELVMMKAKPKQRRKHQIAIKEMKNNLTETVISNIELRKQKVSEYTKLKKNRLDAVNYIKETCEWQEDVLVKIGYLSKDSESKSCVTLMGRACSGINESDAFLTVEYLIQLFERFEANDTMSATMAFVLGTFIDERELNKEESDDNQSFREKFKTIVSDSSVINNVEYELNELKNIYEKLASEERLRDASMKLTPDFGAYVYLWTIEELSYSQLVQKLCGSLYEGNFVKNMLKVHNICEEWKNVADIYQRPDFAGLISNIQTKIIRDIVICDSLYIQS